MKKHTPAALAFAISLAAATTLMAQAPSSDVDAVTSTPAAVRIEKQGNVEYLTGGVGFGERDVMRAQQDEYPLHILFSGKAGEYGVADKVRVLNGRGEVAAIRNAGPLLMMKLRPGTYTIEADFGGNVERRSVTVGREVQNLHWQSAAVSSN